ncbi:hypothetical protein AF306_06860 [Listeria monocytogenes]|nr:hypothetical protein [Listeria monocytogenes]EAD8588717.1 hypothetical protein [Listeria monocytogenes]EAD8591920.1 hypothetical protein [Listeria monocytogenes]EAD8600940.1 hypothetical protein [Listeria monocytogenes]
MSINNWCINCGEWLEPNHKYESKIKEKKREGKLMIPPFRVAEDEFIAISTAEELLDYIKHAEELISIVRESRSKAYKELANRGLRPIDRSME